MNKINVKAKIFHFLILILFIIFLMIFYSNKYGYYEYKKRAEISLTEEQIKRFENDLKEGKDVNLENYLVNNKINYNNKLSRMGLKISNKAVSLVKYGVDSFFRYISKYVN